MRLSASVIAIAVLAPLSAFGQDAPPPAAPAAAPPAEAPPPAPAPVVVTTAPVAAPDASPPAKTWKDLVTIDGLVDSYYQYNFSGEGTNKSLIGPALRNFDVNSNTFTLNYAKIGLGMSADKAALRIDLGYGATGFIINNAVPPVALPMGTSQAPSTGFLIQQAYATLTPITNFTIDFGKFVTTAGAEVIEANKNWLYSRSFLFFNIPLVHTGVRLGYKVNDMISVQASVQNGWNGNGIDVDTNPAKTFGFNAVLTLPMGVGIIPTIYVGDEGYGDTRFLADLVATYAMGPLGLNLNFDFLQDTNAGIDPFWGISVMGHYAVSDALNATLRGEYASNKAGGMTTGYYEVTAGVAAPFSGHFELRPEFRFDGSDQPIFNTKKNQVTLTLAALAYF